MTLAELAHLIGAEPKWVLNVLAALEQSPRYSPTLARRLAVTHTIIEATGAPVARAFEVAEKALRSDPGSPVVIRDQDGSAGVWIDLPRILSTFNARLSLLRTTFAPRQRGRPPARRRNALAVATEWGIDLTLLADNVRKSPEQRLRQLDVMLSFARKAKRHGS